MKQYWEQHFWEVLIPPPPHFIWTEIWQCLKNLCILIDIHHSCTEYVMLSLRVTQTTFFTDLSGHSPHRQLLTETITQKPESHLWNKIKNTKWPGVFTFIAGKGHFIRKTLAIKLHSIQTETFIIIKKKSQMTVVKKYKNMQCSLNHCAIQSSTVLLIVMNWKKNLINRKHF